MTIATTASFYALHKISYELASFAQELARIAEQEKCKSCSLADASISYHPAPLSALTPIGSNAVPKSADKDNPSIISKAIREIIRRGRMRDRYFAAELFADPAWDILLDLYAAMLEQKSVSVSSLCIAAAVPPTPALRWITSMTENGMLMRRMDPVDAQRVFIELAKETVTKLDSYSVASRNRATLAI